MHIGLFTIGSRGDVQPFIALAIGLKNQGYQVTLATHENFRAFVTSYGIDFHGLHGDTEGLLHTEQGKNIVRTGNMSQFLRYAFKALHDMRVPLRKSILEGLEKVDFAIINCSMAIFTNTATEYLNKNHLLIQLNPPNLPTREFPALDLDKLNWPWFNKISYTFFNELLWQLFKKDVNEWRKELGMKPAKYSLLQEIIKKQIPIIHTFSEALLPRPKDWKGPFPVTGFLTIPPENRISNPDDDLPLELIQWLQNGPAPVYMGFGSIPIPDTAQFVHLVEKAIEKLGIRVVICAGWSRFDPIPSHPSIFFIEKADHDRLMPLCSAGLVHGGIGSLAAVLRAGIPAIVCSLFADQPIWGKLVEKQGLGVHLPWKKLSEETLALAIETVSSPQIKEKAQIVGAPGERVCGRKRGGVG